MPGKKKTAARRKVTAKRLEGAIQEECAVRWVGKPIPRKEEARLIRGKGKFVDDYKMSEMLHLCLVRSPYGHARVVRIDVSQAEKAPSVVCTLTGPEVAKLVRPFLEIGPEPGGKIVDYPMGIEKVHYQGEPVAAVVAQSRLAAVDAAELVQVDYQALPAVIDRKSTRLNSSHIQKSRMPSSA